MAVGEGSRLFIDRLFGGYHMSIAALIRAMAAAGAPPEAIAIAVEAIEAAGDAQACMDARSPAAIRQERYRRNKASQGITGVTDSVTDGATDASPKPFPLVPPKETSNPPLIPQSNTHISGATDANASAGDVGADAGEAGELGELPNLPPPPQPRRGQGKGGYHPLPLGWVPVRDLSESLLEAKGNWPPGWQRAELEAFRNWAVNAADADGKGRKKDWDAAWQNWLRDRWNDYRKRNGNGAGGDRNGTGAGYRNALARAASEDAGDSVI
jgi:hypothetical protein